MGSPLNLTRQDEKRLKILAAAEETFLEKGFHAASMSDIARKAGISTPHLYNFYENKAAIALSVQEKMAEETFTLLTGAMNSEPEEQEKFIKHLLDPRRASLTLTMMTEATRNPVVMERVVENGEKLMTQLREHYHIKEDDEDRLFRLEVSMRLFLGISIGSVFCGIVEGGKLRNILMEINRWLVDNKSETNCLMVRRKRMLSSQELVQFRRDLHSYPETGWCEFVTTFKVVQKLRSFGIEPKFGRQIINPEFVAGRNEKAVEAAQKAALDKGVSAEFLEQMGGYTGVLATIETGRPGPVLAVRFDMDCVDVQEALEAGHRPFDEGWASTNPGHMHSCGHDGHTTMGIGLCSWLVENKDKLCGTIKVLFQPAEEGVRGARPVAESGVLDDADYFFGNHLGFNLPTGTISPEPGLFLASTKLDAEFVGLAAHSGADPHKGKNALLAAATATLAVHGIIRPVQETTALNVGTLHAGQGRNVVAPNAFMQLEVRGETEEVNSYMREEAIRKIKASADMYDCEVKIVKAGEATEFKPDRKAIDLVYEAAIPVVGEEMIKKMDLKLGSEDCTILLRRVQQRGGVGTFIIFGCETKAGHHQRLFDFDERVLDIAVSFYKNLVPMICGFK